METENKVKVTGGCRELKVQRRPSRGTHFETEPERIWFVVKRKDLPFSRLSQRPPATPCGRGRITVK